MKVYVVFKTLTNEIVGVRRTPEKAAALANENYPAGFCEYETNQ